MGPAGTNIEANGLNINAAPTTGGMAERNAL